MMAIMEVVRTAITKEEDNAAAMQEEQTVQEEKSTGKHEDYRSFRNKEKRHSLLSCPSGEIVEFVDSRRLHLGSAAGCISPTTSVTLSSSLSPLSGLFTFLPERGIFEKTVQNKSLKVYKVSPIGACARAHEPKTCARGPFLIKRGITEQTVKNKRWKGYKVRQLGGVDDRMYKKNRASPILSCVIFIS